MTKLSLCMIVKNEEANLSQCLESVKGIVDEMVVMDTGSTDKTVEIAQEFGAKVPHFEWCDDFSAARNEALKSVTGDWILVLDADERLTPGIITYLKPVMEDENNLVINLVRHEIGSSQSPYSLVSRLFRNHPEIHFTRPYHAIIDDSVIQLLKIEKHWKIFNLPSIAISHYGYQPKAIIASNKTERARKAMEGYWQKNPNDPYICNKLGALYLQIGKEAEGIKLLKNGLKSNQADANTLFELHYHLGNIYARQGKLEPAIKHYQKAITQPILPQLKLGAYNNFGSLLHSMGDLKAAQQVYEFAIQIDPSFYFGYYNLGMILTKLGRFPEAVSAYQKAIQLNPNYAPAYQNLGLLFFKTGYIPESIEAFTKAMSIYKVYSPEEAEKLRQGLQAIGIKTIDN